MLDSFLKIHSMILHLYLQSCYLLMIIKRKSELLIDVFRVFFLLSSQLRSSVVSVVFDFSDSLINVVPVSLILLSVDVMRKGKSELLMDVFCVFLLSSRLRLSAVSVAFDFNDSLNDAVPVSPILLSNSVKWNC